MAERSSAQLALGNAVKRLRIRRGISQEELGLRSRMHRTYVGGIECGIRNPSYMKLAQLASALEVPLSELLADAERGASSTIVLLYGPWLFAPGVPSV